MIELEKTYLAKSIPEGLASCKKKEIIDIYVPEGAEHPCLRIRKNGGKHEITKKKPLDEADASRQEENTIPLSEEEFKDLNTLKGKRVRKTRYYYPFEGRTAEVDVFEDGLKGLVVVDFEFETEEEQEAFMIPAFCLVDITQEDFIAGGMLAGKTYEDIEEELERFAYKRLSP